MGWKLVHSMPVKLMNELHRRLFATSDIHSGILSDISSDIFYGMSSDTLSDFFVALYLAYLLHIF